MSAYKKQIGGSHYKSMVMQPSEFINKNRLQFAEGSAIKYICRHSAKGKEEDIHKAIHYLEMILERDYSKAQKKEETWAEGYKEWKRQQQQESQNDI
jgi:hypothetical protein